jgi:hypothetical protein
MIAATLAHLRLKFTRGPERVEFTDDLDDLWWRWLRPFAGTGEGDGWLDQLDDASLSLTKERLPEWLPEAVAALCWLTVQPGGGHRERVVAFQPVLAATFAHNLIEPTNMTARYLSAVTGRTVTPAEVDSQLLNAIEYIDDALWCSRTAEELHLEDLNFQARQAPQGAGPPGRPWRHQPTSRPAHPASCRSRPPLSSLRRCCPVRCRWQLASIVRHLRDHCLQTRPRRQHD